MTPFTPAIEILLSLQLAMGLFDILWHHEMTERLTWRATARREQVLHGLRNGLYGVIFFSLAWLEWRGLLAWGLLAILAAEALITLADFVEEDRSRLLPASERVTHTLLALNYGVLLALLAPRLWAATDLPDGVAWQGGGVFALVLTLAAAGCLFWGWRDLARARRLARPGQPAAGLADAFLERRQRLLITGASGFVGRRLVAALVAAGHEVTVLLRDRRKAAWLPTPLRVIGSLAELHPATRLDAIVHLAGATVAAPWTAAHRRQIVDSRVEMTRALLAWCRRAEVPPRLLIGASATGYYGDRGESVLSEGDATGQGFCAEVCRAVEAALAEVPEAGPRRVALRIGLVLDGDGGMLGRLMLPAELGLAPVFGRGRQWLAWIHRDDLVRMICWLLGRADAEGVFNATAPHPLRQRDFAGLLAGCFHRRWLRVPLPGWLLRRGLRQMGRELFLASQRVLPRRALAAGFRFRHGYPAQALVAITGSGAPPDLAPLAGPACHHAWMARREPAPADGANPDRGITGARHPGAPVTSP